MNSTFGPMKTETFTAHGKIWTKHTPGDPMPIDGNHDVYVLFRDDPESHFDMANGFHWEIRTDGQGEEIIGWRYADADADPDPYDASLCAKYKTALEYVAQHGKERPISRVVQVCEMALAGIDLAQVMRENAEPSELDRLRTGNEEMAAMLNILVRIAQAKITPWS